MDFNCTKLIIAQRISSTRDADLILYLKDGKIVSDISPETGLQLTAIDELGERDRCDIPILIAEDSPLLNKLIVDCLEKAGFSRVVHTENGQDAWNYLCRCKVEGGIYDKVNCIITDIEMPKMDGHRLTKLVKSDDMLKSIPVIIFSSLINDEMRRKGEQLGADAQLTKPEIGKLVEEIDKVLGRRDR